MRAKTSRIATVIFFGVVIAYAATKFYLVHSDIGPRPLFCKLGPEKIFPQWHQQGGEFVGGFAGLWVWTDREANAVVAVFSGSPKNIRVNGLRRAGSLLVIKAGDDTSELYVTVEEDSVRGKALIVLPDCRSKLINLQTGDASRFATAVESEHGVFQVFSKLLADAGQDVFRDDLEKLRR